MEAKVKDQFLVCFLCRAITPVGNAQTEYHGNFMLWSFSTVTCRSCGHPHVMGRTGGTGTIRTITEEAFSAFVEELA